MNNQDDNNKVNHIETTRKEVVRKLPYKIRLLHDFVPTYTGAGTEYMILGKIVDDHQLEIVEERQGKGQKLWGRLKSNAGWILLENAERLTI